MEGRFLPVLFLLLTLTASTVVATAGSGNGGLQDPAEEENSLRPEPDCRIPPYSNPARIVPEPSNIFEDESYLIESRCYLACVNSGQVRISSGMITHLSHGCSSSFDL